MNMLKLDDDSYITLDLIKSIRVIDDEKSCRFKVVAYSTLDQCGASIEIYSTKPYAETPIMEQKSQIKELEDENTTVSNGNSTTRTPYLLSDSREILRVSVEKQNELKKEAQKWANTLLFRISSIIDSRELV